jgi:hypothetical protein
MNMTWMEERSAFINAIFNTWREKYYILCIKLEKYIFPMKVTDTGDSDKFKNFPWDWDETL